LSYIPTTLAAMGWTEARARSFAPYREDGYELGRVIQEQREAYTVWTEAGVFSAEVSGKLRFAATSRGDFPAVGDFVGVSCRADEGKATIHQVLPRFSKFARKVAGFITDEQIVAANVDTVFLVMALNHDFNLRRLERYLTMAWESGANPVIVLTKADLCEDSAVRELAVAAIAPSVPVHSVSVVSQVGLEALKPYLQTGQTVALLGSSGVGKSSLLNHFANEKLQRVSDVRTADERGRHTTTARTLFALHSGGLVIDTPGMRELQMLDNDGAEASLAETFADIAALAETCRFRDCQHEAEPGCRVQEAITTGRLSEQRLASYRKLQRELAYVARKEDERQQLAERAKWKQLSIQQRQKGHRR